MFKNCSGNNFVRIHKTLKTTPAMAAGVTDKLWDVMDIVDVIEAWENLPLAIEPSENADLEQLRGDADGWLPEQLKGMQTSYGRRRSEEKLQTETLPAVAPGTDFGYNSQLSP